MMARLTVDSCGDRYAVEVDAAEVSLSVLCDRDSLEAFIERAQDLLGHAPDRAALHSHAAKGSPAPAPTPEGAGDARAAAVPVMAGAHGAGRGGTRTTPQGDQ